jgi:hypothetical protein
VVQIAWRQRRDPAGQGKRFRMPELKRRRKSELACLRSYGLDDRSAAMSRVGAPKTRAAIDDGAALWAEIMHVLSIGEKSRALLERTIGRKRHPIGVKIISQ